MKFYEPSLLRKFTIISPRTPTSSKLPELTICYLGVFRSFAVEFHMPVKRFQASILCLWKTSNASARTVNPLAK
jgi:hypothetical protein